jgi:hypothetical protein
VYVQSRIARRNARPADIPVLQADTGRQFQEKMAAPAKPETAAQLHGRTKEIAVETVREIGEGVMGSGIIEIVLVVHRIDLTGLPRRQKIAVAVENI